MAEAFRAVAVAARECYRLVGLIPTLWHDEAAYCRLAAGVREAVEPARRAYTAVDIRLRRAGGPNATLETLEDALTTAGRAPPDPSLLPGGLNAVLTRLYTHRHDHFRPVEDKGWIDRMLDQLARVPPVCNHPPTYPTVPAPPPAGTGETDRGAPAAGVTPGWAALGDAKRAILTVLNGAEERMRGNDIAKKAGYTGGTLRHHFPELQTWNYIDKAKDGYAITPTGTALVLCGSV